LNIVVCVKQTPDTAATISVEGGQVSWGDAPLVLNPWDEFAVEEALQTKEAHGGKVTAISLGSEEAKEALKQALAMGCDEAILVGQEQSEGIDSLVASKVLAAAIRKVEDVELVFFGKQAVDTDTGLTNAQVARRLGWPSLSLVSKIQNLDPTSGSIEVERLLEEGRQQVRSSLPAVISVVKEINEPRYPSFMGIRKASKAEIPSWTMTDIGVNGALTPVLHWQEIYAPEQAETECELIEGDSPEDIASKLVDRLMEEKVL
jgi:electron transfer flavoprotein beta subunit